MKERQLVDLPASVRQRLLNLSKARGEDFNLTLTRYGTERLLYRLSKSDYAGQFVLKGAMLFSLWTGRLQRPTRDLDLLGYGASSQEALTRTFRDISQIDATPDGLTFHPDSVKVTEIREGQRYRGQRVHLMATLGNARIHLQVDVGFGDVITPPAREVDFPSMLGFPSARLRAYSKETVIAEKLEAMAVLGIANSRMKDFYDVWMMSREFPFDGRMLARAIGATFRHHAVELPRTSPTAFTEAFAQDPIKLRQWGAFLSRNRLDAGGLSFSQVVAEIRLFLMPVILAAANGQELDADWPEAGPWVATQNNMGIP